MSRAIVIARRELSSYFYSPIAYVAMFAFLLAAGGLFWDDFKPGQPAAMRTIFEWMVWLLVAIIPLLCMGLLAREGAPGTIEATIMYVLMLRIYGDPDLGPIFSGYLGILLVGSLFIAVGLFCSSLTRSQVVAAVLAVAVLCLLTIIPYWA